MHAQITQNNKYAISLQYLKKEVSDEVDLFCMHISMKASYRLMLWFLMGDGQVPKIKNLQYPCNISRKTGRMKLISCFQINIKDFFKLILSFLMSVPKCAQITQNNKFAICSILRKSEWWSWFSACR